MDKAFYVFCFARSDLLPEINMTGLDGQGRIFRVDFQSVSAILCEVPVDQFSGPSSETTLQDPEWVGPRAIRHGGVVQEIMNYSPVLPARFGTLFSSEENLDRFLRSKGDDIAGFLAHVADKDEWAVRGLCSKPRVRDRLFAEKISTEAANLASLSAGLRYFKEVKIRTEVEKELGKTLRTVLNAIGDNLSAFAEEWHRREILLRSKGNSDMETVANWAFLVARSNVEDFKSLVLRADSDHEDLGIRLELSGPWPPYSFCPPLAVEPEE